MGVETRHVCDYCRKVVVDWAGPRKVHSIGIVTVIIKGWLSAHGEDEYGLYLCGECYNKAKREIAGLMKQMGATVVSAGR